MKYFVVRKSSYTFYLAAIVFILSLPSQAYAQFIKVDNGHVVDGENRLFKFHSVNLGGWLLWEGWIWGGGLTQETILRDRLQKITSPDDYNEFVKQYYDNFITEKDIAAIAGAGFNSIRVPFNYRIFGTYDRRMIDGYAKLDELIGWCKKYHVYIILDMHAAPGGQNSWFVSDPGEVKLFDSAELQEKTCQLWESIAERYHDEHIIAGYDLLNEPDVKDNSTLIDFYRKLISRIRAVDKNHMLFVEGNKLAKDFTGFPGKLDSNQVYSYHYYAWFNEHSKEKAMDKILSTIPAGALTWCGEWGEDTRENLNEIRSLLNKQKNLCGESIWTWKRYYKNNDHYPLCSFTSSAEWERVVGYLTYGFIKPKPQQVINGTQYFLNAIRFDNCKTNF